MGGSDSINIGLENLPKHKFSVTGQTADFDYGTKKTTIAPPRKHRGGMVGPGESWDDDYIVGSDNDNEEPEILPVKTMNTVMRL